MSNNVGGIQMNRINWLVIRRKKGTTSGPVMASCSIKDTAQKLARELRKDADSQEEFVVISVPAEARENEAALTKS